MLFTKLLFLCSLIPLISFSNSDDKIFVKYSDKILEESSDSCIVIVGDTQQTSFWEFWRESNTEFTPIILSKIADENPAMIIHLGDVVFQGSSESHWNDFNKFAAPIYNKQIPIFPILGNHEYFGNNETALKNYFYHFPSANNKQWYSKKYKSICFIFLNSNFDNMSICDINEQDYWLDSTVSAAENDERIIHIIFASHIPPYTNSKVVDDDINVQNYFVPVFKRSKKAILFLSGHAHSYEHFIKEGKHFLVSGGGGGPRHELATDSNSKNFHFDLYSGSQLRNLHYCKLIIHKNNLEIKMIQIDKDTKEWSTGDCFFIPD
jgi:Icc-related predicted phosphoesterase